MTRLHQLHDRYGQSPWLDNLTRGDVAGGRLRRLIDEGIRGVTSNPTIIAKAVGGSTDYDGQLAALTAAGLDKETAVPAVFLFRLATFWLPILPGWLAFTWLQRTDRI